MGTESQKQKRYFAENHDLPFRGELALGGERELNSDGSNVTLQGYTKAAENGESDVAFATFNSSKIRPIHIGSESKRFLSQADALSLRPNSFAQFVKSSLLVHRRG